GAGRGGPPAYSLTRPHAGPAMSTHRKTANSRITPKTTLSTLDGYTMRWRLLSGGRVGWPKGVPRIAMLDDETRSSGSRAANRRFSPPSLISVPLMPNKEVPNKATSPPLLQLLRSLTHIISL